MCSWQPDVVPNLTPVLGRVYIPKGTGLRTGHADSHSSTVTASPTDKEHSTVRHVGVMPLRLKCMATVPGRGTACRLCASKDPERPDQRPVVPAICQQLGCLLGGTGQVARRFPGWTDGDATTPESECMLRIDGSDCVDEIVWVGWGGVGPAGSCERRRPSPLFEPLMVVRLDGLAIRTQLEAEHQFQSRMTALARLYPQHGIRPDPAGVPSPETPPARLLGGCPVWHADCSSVAL